MVWSSSPVFCVDYANNRGSSLGVVKEYQSAVGRKKAALLLIAYLFCVSVR